MASSYRSAPDPREARRRATAIALTVAAHLLIALLLLTLAPPLTDRGKDQRTLSTFDVAREPGSAPKAAAKRTPVRQAAKAAAPAAASRATAQRPADAPVAPPVPVSPLWGDKSLFAGGDIGRIRTSGEEGSATAAAGSGSGRGSGSVAGPGEGPGGSHLANAQWYRRPSHAEIAGYMPKAGVPSGAWAEIACRTVPGNQVENCRQLGESPPGSGIARGLRLAAWQFRVLAPRVDGRPVIGVWVRIHFDFNASGEGDAR